MEHKQRSIIEEWNKVTRELNKFSHALLLFDYDGTLAPIKKSPPEARLPIFIRKKLTQLSRLSNCTVGVISGRSLMELRHLVGIPGIIYVGNHGLEIENDGWSFVHPAAKGKKASLQKLARHFSRMLIDFKGVFVENKGLTLSIHFRQVNPEQRQSLLKLLKAEFLGMAVKHRLLVRQGRKVFEILPISHWHKGAAVTWLKNIVPPKSVVLYIGDDTTDEDVFRVLQKRGISIRVGAKKSSSAAYYLKRQNDVGQFIRKIFDYFETLEKGNG